MNITDIANSDELDNADARMLVNKLAQRFGWEYAIFCPEDIGAELESRLVEPDGYAIDAVQSNHYWKHLGVILESHGYDMLLKAVDEVTGTESEELVSFKKWGD